MSEKLDIIPEPGDVWRYWGGPNDWRDYVIEPGDDEHNVALRFKYENSYGNRHYPIGEFTKSNWEYVGNEEKV
jgi:hypothetical protein